MKTRNDDATPAATIPTIEAIIHVWDVDYHIPLYRVRLYIFWVAIFRSYCSKHRLIELNELTFAGATTFIDWYAKHCSENKSRLVLVPSALYALSLVYRSNGIGTPAWREVKNHRRPKEPILKAYYEYLIHRRGSPELTATKKCKYVQKFLRYLKEHDKTWRRVHLSDIDEFLVQCARMFAHATVADLASVLRCFCRFLFLTKRNSQNVADSIIAPLRRRYPPPHRTLSQEELRRLMKSIDTSTATGVRDYAILLVMVLYGLGAGEVIRLKLDDIDWNLRTISIIRPKTGVGFTLPLLPPVAKALARYLRTGRPPKIASRCVFVRSDMPFDGFGASGAIRHILHKHAKAAGLDVKHLGTHVLRFSHARRQIQLGIRPKVLTDIFGHRDPESISAYVRIETESLRDVSLPVPK